LEGWVLDPQSLSELPQHSLGKSGHLNRPGKKRNSGFGLPSIAVTKKSTKKIYIFTSFRFAKRYPISKVRYIETFLVLRQIRRLAFYSEFSKASVIMQSVTKV